MKLLVGFITYENNTSKYLEFFLPSLLNQTYKDFEIVAADNSRDSDNENSRFILKNYKNIEMKWMGDNLGFSKANNFLIKKSKEKKAEYILFLNPDMILEPDAIEKMIKKIEADGDLGSVGPKVRRWIFREKDRHPSPDLEHKFKNSDKKSVKTKIIDTCGIIRRDGLRFFDLGEAQIDKGQFDKAHILGPSGCAALYKIKALEEVAFKDGDDKEYFDELMFMYKEDVDLAYRLFLAGYKSALVADAIVYHDRTGAGQGQSNLKTAFNRKNKSKFIKNQSFLHQHIIFLRFWRFQNFLEKVKVIYFAFKMLVFVIIFEKYLLKNYLKLWKIRKEIKKKNLTLTNPQNNL